MDFDSFCAVQFITGSNKEAFRVWLGKTASMRLPESVWLSYFAEWVRSKK